MNLINVRRGFRRARSFVVSEAYTLTQKSGHHSTLVKIIQDKLKTKHFLKAIVRLVIVSVKFGSNQSRA